MNGYAYCIGLMFCFGLFASLDTRSKHPSFWFVLLLTILWPLVLPLFVFGGIGYCIGEKLSE